ncbi:membrane protein Ycf1 [Medicago truncatula]|uniref:Membrane protein Ycf1 n=1 Tax=Medicago truncatula TaxID=3880 RepID=G7LE32_MEDTR|nr:membrane protein Ycf1 [Medicago truncatula]
MVEISITKRGIESMNIVWDSSDQEIGMDNTNLFCLLLIMKKLKKIVIMSIKKLELDIEMLVDSITKDFCYTECRDTQDLKERLIFFIETIRLPTKNVRCEKVGVGKKSRVDQKITENKDKNLYDLFVPENLLSTRRPRELRILTCFNRRNRKTINDNENQIKNVSQVLAKNKDLDKDLACINHYWFNTHNGSHFSILRIHVSSIERLI